MQLMRKNYWQNFSGKPGLDRWQIILDGNLVAFSCRHQCLDEGDSVQRCPCLRKVEISGLVTLLARPEEKRIFFTAVHRRFDFANGRG